jgi:hypothetical protein
MTWANTATATSTFAIASDTDVDITGPTDGALINDDTPTITGTSLPNASIEVSIEIDGNDVVIGTVTANGDGVWTIDVTNPLADGPYFVTATATDVAGNMAEDASSFTVDTETFITIDTVDPTTGTITGTGEPRRRGGRDHRRLAGGHRHRWAGRGPGPSTQMASTWVSTPSPPRPPTRRATPRPTPRP